MTDEKLQELLNASKALLGVTEVQKRLMEGGNFGFHHTAKAANELIVKAISTHISNLVDEIDLTNPPQSDIIRES